MTAKILKVAAVVAYLAVQIGGEHIQVPVLLFLIGSLFEGSNAILSALVLLTLFVLLWTIFRPDTKWAKIIVPVGIVILYLPFINYFIYLSGYNSWIDTTAFKITFGLFVVLSVVWLVLTFREKQRDAVMTK